MEDIHFKKYHDEIILPSKSTFPKKVHEMFVEAMRESWAERIDEEIFEYLKK